MRRTHVRGLLRVLLCSLALLASGCGILSAPQVPTEAEAAPSPTLLPPPKPISSPEAAPARTIASPPAGPPSPPPVAAAPPTRIPPPNLNATPPSAPAVPTGAGGERARVVNTDGQGANMRAEPAATAQLVRTIKEAPNLTSSAPSARPAAGAGATSAM